MLFDNITVRLLGSDDFPTDAKLAAAADLTTAAREGTLLMAISEPLALEEVARAHDLVDSGSAGRVLLRSE